MVWVGGAVVLGPVAGRGGLAGAVITTSGIASKLGVSVGVRVTVGGGARVGSVVRVVGWAVGGLFGSGVGGRVGLHP